MQGDRHKGRRGIPTGSIREDEAITRAVPDHDHPRKQVMAQQDVDTRSHRLFLDDFQRERATRTRVWLNLEDYEIGIDPNRVLTTWMVQSLAER
jgi:hypothetical protein